MPILNRTVLWFFIFQEDNVPAPAFETLNLARDEFENQAGIFERKELLSKGDSVLKWMKGNKTEAQLMAGISTSVGCGLRLENWSQFTLTEPTAKFEYGTLVEQMELNTVGPGFFEVSAMKQVSLFCHFH